MVVEEEKPSGNISESRPAAGELGTGRKTEDSSGTYREGYRDMFYSVSEAAKILNVTHSRVRQLARDGRIGGERAEGVWKLYRYSVHAFRDQKRERELPQEPSEGSLEARVLLDEVRTLERTLGRLEGRLELSERAESTLREERDRLLEDLERERQRAENVERQAEKLAAEREEAEREAQRLATELEAERSKGFWRRLFGG